MKTAAQTTLPERLGRTLGRAWRSCVRLDRRANGWLVAQGWAPGAAKAVLVILKLAVLGVLFYAAFWLALLLLFAAAAAWLTRNSEPEESDEWAIGEQAEHKNNPGYDPILYNDMPDPRFDKD